MMNLMIFVLQVIFRFQNQNYIVFFRLRNTFRSTLRDAAKVTKVKDMVRYVKRPHSAIEKTSYRDSRSFQVMNVYVHEN